MPSLLLFAVIALPLLCQATSTPSYLVSRIRRPEKRFVDEAGHYNITIVHVNDVHAHLDHFVAAGTDCTANKPCLGGYARIKTKVQELRSQYNDSLVINAGDEFQGTLFYTYLGPSVIADTINQIGFDVMTLGNHEFDGGIDPLVPFIKSLNFPVICANIQSNRSDFQSLLTPYKIFSQHDLAIVAVTTSDIPGISNPGPGTDFPDPIKTVQDTVDHILGGQLASRIVVLTHIGYDLDIQLAKSTRNVHLVVGGHSHTLLGDFQGSQGPYPTIVNNLDGDEVFVVTSFKWGEYLGKIDVAFDAAGKIVAYTGAPIPITDTIVAEPSLQGEIDSWKSQFQAMGNVKVGNTAVDLIKDGCQSKECNIGDVMADAMAWYRQGHTDGALMNAGGIRASLNKGDITKGDALTVFPFMNAVVDLPLTGQQIWDTFEAAVSKVNAAGHEVTSFIQVSNEIAFTYNPKKSLGSRMVSLTIGGQPIDKGKTYTLTTVDYIANGGDYLMPQQSGYVILDTLDVVFSDYVAAHSPINTQVGTRIQQVDSSDSASGFSTRSRRLHRL